MERYRSLKSYLNETFGCRIYKVTLDAGLTCPNRDGTIGYGGCIYCNEKGSGTGAFKKGISLEKQLKEGIEALKRKYKAEKFIAYFQSFTNSYGNIEVLKKNYEIPLNHPDVSVISVGTRPDCIETEVIDLLKGYAKFKKVWLEIGLQSSSNKTLNSIRRGHSSKEFTDAMRKTGNKGFHRIAHIILGLPDEGGKEFMETAKFLAGSGVEGVKIHLFYITKTAPFYESYSKGGYKPMEKDEYVDAVCSFLELLPQDMVIHRLTGNAHRGELVAPLWSANKSAVISEIKNELEKRGTFQGAKYEKR